MLHTLPRWIDVVGKGDKHRRLPLNAVARRALDAILPTPLDDAGGAIFCGKRGPYTARGTEYLVAELGRRAQVPNVHPHRFRHDAARRLVESADLPTVATWLGHERLDTVRISSQPDAARARAGCRSLGATIMTMWVGQTCGLELHASQVEV